MSNPTRARVSARSAARIAACCSAAGIGLTAAFLITDMVEHHTAATHASGLADAAARGFSESALRLRSEAMTPGALAIAQRHDPLGGGAGMLDATRDSRSAKFAQQLEASARQTHQKRTVSFTSPARPFVASGAMAGARDMECLTQAVYYEARGESPGGQAAVAQVVLNRVRHRAFPSSVCGVVYQGAQSGRSCQFSFACDGSMRRTRNEAAWRRSQKVASRALSGFVMADVGTATHFHAARIGPQWGSMVRVAQVGLHVFYRFGGRNGGPGAFQRPSKPREEPQVVYASLLPVMETPSFIRLGAEEAAKSISAAIVPAAAKPAPLSKPALLSKPAGLSKSELLAKSELVTKLDPGAKQDVGTKQDSGAKQDASAKEPAAKQDAGSNKEATAKHQSVADKVAAAAGSASAPVVTKATQATNSAS